MYNQVSDEKRAEYKVSNEVPTEPQPKYVRCEACNLPLGYTYRDNNRVRQLQTVVPVRMDGLTLYLECPCGAVKVWQPGDEAFKEFFRQYQERRGRILALISECENWSKQPET